MPEEFESASPVKAILRLMLQIEETIDAPSHTLYQLLYLRNRIYDVLHYLEQLPIAGITEHPPRATSGQGRVRMISTRS